MHRILILAVAISALTAKCGDGATSPAQTGTLTISLTDAPANLEQVNITFSEVSAHIDGEWLTVQGEPRTVDLLEWNNGRSIALGTAEVPHGEYTQIRLKIDQASVTSEGQTYEATVPSGARSGLKLVSGFTVGEGTTHELIVDFDARRSIVATGPPSDPRRFQLKPTIRVVPRALTGAIRGTLADPAHTPTAYAILGADTVTSAVPDTTTGVFILSFLPAATYEVAIEDSLGRTFTQAAQSVTAGTTAELGKINLQ